MVKRLFFMIGLCACCALSLYAEFYKPLYTYYNFLSGTKSLSMGNAFVGAADDLSTVFLNPAGITKFKVPQFYASFKTDKIHYDYESQEKNFGSYSQEYDYDFVSRLKNINFLSLSVPLVLWQMKWNFAIGYYRYNPYGHEGYSRETLTTLGSTKNIDRLTTNFSGSGGIDVLAFCTAFNLVKNLSFGITMQQFINSGVRSYDRLPGPVEYKDYTCSEKLEGRNFIFGVLFNVYKDITVGFTYHTGSKHRFQSQEQWQEDVAGKQGKTTSGEVYLPDKFALGTSIKLVKFLNLAYEFSRINWSAGKIGDLPYPIRDNFSFSQSDIINHRLGIECDISLKKVRLYLRSGFSWEKQLFRAADSAAVRVKAFSMGCGFLFFPGVALDLAYVRQRANWPEAGYFDPQAFINSAYRNKILSLALTYHFALRKR